MPKEKKKKIQECYQLVDANDNPVRIITGINGSYILPAKSGKIFKSRSVCISTVKRHLQQSSLLSSNIKHYKHYLNNKEIVTKDVWCNYLLGLKIQIFQPVSTIDLAFYLDKIRK